MAVRSRRVPLNSSSGQKHTSPVERLDGSPDGDAEAEGESDGEFDGLAEALGLKDAEGESDGEFDGDADADGERDGLAEGDSLADGSLAAPIAKYVTQHAEGSASSMIAVNPLASMDLMSMRPTTASSTTCAYTASSWLVYAVSVSARLSSSEMACTARLVAEVPAPMDRRAWAVVMSCVSSALLVLANSTAAGWKPTVSVMSLPSVRVSRSLTRY